MLRYIIGSLLIVPFLSSATVIKMSRSNICHPPASMWFEKTSSNNTFETIDACIEAGGRLPKGMTVERTRSTQKVIASSATLDERGNTTNPSFNKAKKYLHSVQSHHQRTFYCDAAFDGKGNVTLPPGFETPGHVNRSKKIEAEHLLPAENMGRAFEYWHLPKDDARCLNSKGKRLSNRDCTLKNSKQFQLMHADLYGLKYAIGSVNAYRSNYRFTMFGESEPAFFGSCDMKISSRAVEPPERARGPIARSYLYFDWAYKSYKLSSSQRKLFEAWNKQYPVTDIECKEAIKIEEYQGNRNPFIADQCS
ncbi:endonuclease [Vibrio mediterranei]|uniref:endonuclease n=1 Tax=Vibrio mediterranei TaxID=689 RepID=UPI004069622A